MITLTQLKEALPARQYQTLIRRLSGQSNGKIAKDLGVTLETATGYFSRAIRRINANSGLSDLVSADLEAGIECTPKELQDEFAIVESLAKAASHVPVAHQPSQGQTAAA